MTPALLREAGELLYGPRWQTPLAGAIGVSDRSMRYWAAGSAMPDGAWSDIMALLRKRGVDIGRFVKKHA